MAWRQLDAQYWGVPQRRKRIALVADFRGERAAEILFERTSLSGNLDTGIPPWQNVTGIAQNCTTGHDRVVGDECFCVSGNTVDRRTNQNGTGVKENVAFTVNTVDRHAVAYSLKIRSGCAGGGKGALVQTEKVGTLSTLQDQTLFQAVPVLNDQGGSMMGVTYDVTGTLRAAEHGHQPIVFDARGNGDGSIVPTITGDHESRITDYTAVTVERKCFNEQSYSQFQKSEQSSTLKKCGGGTGNGGETLVAERAIRWIVRRLTPTECERLQGYPDGWTDIGEWTDTKGKKHKPADTPRYKALGNSIALPQWFWIAQKMKPYLEPGAKLGSLFDGIGGFPLVWETTYGKGTARWASEIEEFPIAVTKKRFQEKEVEA